MAALLVLVGLYFFVFPSHAIFFPKCPFYLVTGKYCPGCGSQRAIAALLHGDVRMALHDNLLLVVFLPVLAVWVLSKICDRPRWRSFYYAKWFPWLVFFAVMAFFLLRNISTSPFTCLAPLP